MNAQTKASQWLSFDFISAPHKQEIEKNIEDTQWAEDHFGSDLEFGTGGLRGEVGVGTSRMNIYNIRKITLGLCLAAKKHGNKVVIGYDTRLSSLEFAKAACAVCLNQGFEVHLFRRPTATPAVSFAIRELKATIGINITASHNPPQDNGYKVYWSDGAQVTAPNDQSIMKQITFVSDLTQAMVGTFDENKIKYISSDLEKNYFKYIKSTIPNAWLENCSEVPICYSPLHGVGKWWVENFYQTTNTKSTIRLVPNQAEPDGNFPTVDYANPEDENALKNLVEEMKKNKIRYGLATDPDADRLAVVEIVEGKPYYFTGNEVGALFIYSYLQSLKTEGFKFEKSFVVRTIVTSQIIDKISQDFGVAVKTCLTGFKHIASVLKWFQDSHQMKFLFGTEESIGYLFGDSVRDKDGIQATVMMAQLIKHIENNNLTLHGLLQKIYKQYGTHKEKLKNINLKSYNLNVHKMKEQMEKLRTNYPTELAGFSVLWIYDYQKSAKFKPGEIRNYEQIEMPQSNVIGLELTNNIYIAIRPSGTEPKVKIYSQVSGKPNDELGEEELISRCESVEKSLSDYFLNL